MFHHDIHLTHTRHAAFEHLAVPEASSAVSISVDSNDLVEAMSELLSRLPNDLYAALKTAMEVANK